MNRALLIAALAWTAAASPASAQCVDEPEPSPRIRSVARSRYTDGLEAAEQGRWPEAREAFQRAYDVAPFAQVVFNLATAQAHTGLFVESAESYREFLRRCASEALADLRGQAQDLLAEVTTHIARLTLRIGGFDPREDTLTLNGEEQPAAVLGSPLPVNPGTCELRVVRRGEGEVLRRTVELEEGRTATLELSLPPPALAEGPEEDAPVEAGGGGGGDDGWVVALTAGAGAALGVAVGLLVFFLVQPGAEPLPPGTWAPVRQPLVRF